MNRIIRGGHKKDKVEQPYKRSVSSKPVIEDIEKATAEFGHSKYEMILYAGLRAYQLANGAEPLIEIDVRAHKPTVIAILEIEAGKLKKEHFYQDMK